jgi:hypothetical protein
VFLSDSKCSLNRNNRGKKTAASSLARQERPCYVSSPKLKKALVMPKDVKGNDVATRNSSTTPTSSKCCNLFRICKGDQGPNKKLSMW